jgi:hypothetical protein
MQIPLQNPIRNIVIYGNSPKFIRIVTTLFPTARITILSWRASQSEAGTIINKLTQPIDLLMICGYDYASYLANLDHYLINNVQKILKICAAFATDQTQIIYIDTLSPKKPRTYSRYLYTKKLLGKELVATYPRTQILSIPTVFDSQNKIGMQGGMISKIAAKTLIQLGIIRTIDLDELQTRIKNAIQSPSNTLDSLPMVQAILINIPRPQLVDRALRILLG